MKKLVSAVLAAATALSAMGIAALADDEIKIFVNAEELVIPEGDTMPFIEEERTLVPMRAIFEALGAKVDWDGENRRVTATKDENTVVLDIDSKIMLVNGTEVELDVPAKIVNDRTVVPVRAISESLDCVVYWDQDTTSVYVNEVEDKSALPQEYKTLDELNAAIFLNGPDRFTVAAPTNPLISIVGYEFFAEDNIAQIDADWAVGEGARFFVRVTPGTIPNIIGTGLAKEKEVFRLTSGAEAKVEEDDEVIYATWYNNDYSFGVLIHKGDWDASDVLKEIVNDVDAQYPVKSGEAFYGTRQDSKSQRASLGVIPGDAEGEFYAVVSWSSSANETTIWDMTCKYDAENGTLVYENGTKTDVTYDAEGKMEEKEVYTGSKGSFRLEDGSVFWTDDKDKELAEGCQFNHAYLMNAGEEPAAEEAAK